MSSILNRTDKEYLDYIAGVEAQCKTINKENFCWKEGAGDQSNWKAFGVPDCSGTCTTKTTYSSSCPSFAHNMGGYCMLNNDSSRCAEYGSASAESGYTASVCKTRSASMTQSTSSTVSYPGDTNSCPGFAYSKWDSAGRRYCELNNTRACDYNYPSYLTNGANYKSENCPSTSPSNTTSTVSTCAPNIYNGNKTAANSCDNSYCKSGCVFNANSCARTALATATLTKLKNLPAPPPTISGIHQQIPAKTDMPPTRKFAPALLAPGTPFRITVKHQQNRFQQFKLVRPAKHGIYPQVAAPVIV